MHTILISKDYTTQRTLTPLKHVTPEFNSLSALLLPNIFLSFEVGIAHAIANFK